MYFKLVGDYIIYLVLYLDDMLLVENNMEIIYDMKTQLSYKFDVKDISSTIFILFMKIKFDLTYKKLWLN